MAEVLMKKACFHIGVLCLSKGQSGYRVGFYHLSVRRENIESAADCENRNSISMNASAS